jgi:hypothetical protein
MSYTNTPLVLTNLDYETAVITIIRESIKLLKLSGQSFANTEWNIPELKQVSTYRGMPPFEPTQPIGLIYLVYLHLCTPCIIKLYFHTYKLRDRTRTASWTRSTMRQPKCTRYCVGRCPVMGQMNADFGSLASTSFLSYIHAIFFPAYSLISLKTLWKNWEAVI